MKNDYGSFRDPSGFVYSKNGIIFRQINKSYIPQFNNLITSGLYNYLSDKKWIVKHRIIQNTKNRIILQQEKISYITYPYEWSFSMLKDAALLTLDICKKSLDYNMVLKDSSSYNIQFSGTKPIFIDTLSFDFYYTGTTWIAYRQFCQHFLAPLLLMSQRDYRLNYLLRDYIDGIPLDITSKLLPVKSWLKPAILSHIHLHALNQKRMGNKLIDENRYKMSKNQLYILLSNLENTVKKLNINNSKTEWAKYYSVHNYSNKAFHHKTQLIKNYIKNLKITSLLDLGANNGEFSTISSDLGIYTIASDIDPIAIDKCYLNNRNNKYLLPLNIDLTNPSPAIGWANKERKSFMDRFQVDCVMVLALIHHLAISNNLPFKLIAEYFSTFGKYLIIEYVPKDDTKVKILLHNRKNEFNEYTQIDFEKSFSVYYKIIKRNLINDSKRIIYFMARK